MKTVRLNNGKDINVYDHNEFVSGIISDTKDYFEREELDTIAALYPKHGTILEIGANIGNHVHFYENYLDYERIVCFEPVLWNAEILSSNVVSEVLQCGLWHEEAVTQFNIYEENMGACSVGQVGVGDIHLKTLDSFGFSDVTFIKIDVENAEYNVLKGAEKTLRMNKPLLWIEINYAVSYVKVVELLTKIGYSQPIQLGEQANFLFVYESTK